jgi:riboflavin kinase/FMN adenylyltransferase
LPASNFSLDINDEFPSDLQNGAVTIGNFDGVHRGHAALIADLKEQARSVGGPAIVVTFDPHPIRILTPERFMPLLTTPQDRAELLVQTGADTVIELKTTVALLQIEARDFLEKLIAERLKSRAIVEGFNFGFGKNRAGSTDMLEKWCREKNISCTIVPPFELDGEPVSSSRVRTALDAGSVAGAAKLLNRPYRLRGRVVEGDHRGATLGYPTANLGEILTHIPRDGVYAVRVYGTFGVRAGAANIGPNPTFNVSKRKVEVHLLDFEGELYGQLLAIDFLAKLRDTQRFNSREELIEQLKEDISSACQFAAET